ncbi:MAG: helix-turn-helix domain-containing protein [Coriobacteriales bacterium]|jgi:HTH-type transcriptional regulator/antitoxin HipB|nr:helix-turn-helix domain-containing protein [Coriobacteriales bacterium]
MAWTNSYSLKQTGAFLRNARKQKGYTQDEFAEMIGVSHATLSSFENGKNVSSVVMERVLSYLGFRLVIVPKTASVTVAEQFLESGLKDVS